MATSNPISKEELKSLLDSIAKGVEKGSSKNEQIKKVLDQFENQAAELKHLKKRLAEIKDSEPDAKKRRKDSNKKMLIFSPFSQNQIVKSIIFDLTPDEASKMPPGLPGDIIFMMIRFAELGDDKCSFLCLIFETIDMIEEVIAKKGTSKGTNQEIPAILRQNSLTLQNTLTLRNRLMHYSGYRCKSGTMNLDSSIAIKMLNQVASKLYKNLTSIMEEVFRLLIVGAVYDKSETEGELIDSYHLMIEFEYLFGTISALDQEYIRIIEYRIFDFTCAELLNLLLEIEPMDLCNEFASDSIRAFLDKIRKFAGQKNIQNEERKTKKPKKTKDVKLESVFKPLSEFADLLDLLVDIVNEGKDNKGLTKFCNKRHRLTSHQIFWIIEIFEERGDFDIPQNLYKKFDAILARKTGIEDQLRIDSKLSSDVLFPFVKSKVTLDDLVVPEFNNIHKLLKKI